MNDERLEAIKDRFYKEQSIIDDFKATEEEEVPKEQTGHGISINNAAIDLTSMDLIRESCWQLVGRVKRDERILPEEEKITCYVSKDLQNNLYYVYYLTPKKERHKKLRKHDYLTED